jgi:L-threonylcarbamoyladenylate synthase
MLRVRVSATDPESEVLSRAAAVLRDGGIIVIPTDTLYGLAADPFNQVAVDRVFEAKGRVADRALPLIAADAAQVETNLGPLGASARRLAERFWPGPLTLVVPGPEALARGVANSDGAVGVRVPAHAVARALCRHAGKLLTATSANVSGEPPVDDPDFVARALAGKVDMLIDAGRTPGGLPSTLVDVTGSPRLLRAGAISWEDVERCLRG